MSGGWSKYDKEKYLLIVRVYASSFIKGICEMIASFVKKKITNKKTIR